MSFYSEASLAYIASAGAGKDGKAYSMKPVPEYGSEEIINGDFANGSTNWGGYTTGSSTIVFTDVAILNIDASNSNVGIYQENVFTSGKKYKIVLKMKASSSFDAEVLETQQASTIARIGIISLTTSYQDFTFDFEATGNNDIFIHRKFGESSANQSITIDNVSVKEVLVNGDFTFSRGSNLTATRVGPTGLIEKGRENLLLQSNQFDTTWTLASQMLTPVGGQSGYDGTNDAWKIQRSDTSGRFIRQNISQSGVQTFSVYAKKGNVDYISLVSVGVNVTKSIFSLPTDGSGANTYLDSDNISAKISYISNGWYRVEAVYSDTITDVRIYPSETATAEAGVIADAFVYIQDAQLEIGLAASEPIESGATTGKAGLLEDEPRFDYSGGATCPSLLLEPSRTNMATQSEYITKTTRATITHNQATSPEGLQNAFLAVDSTDANSHIVGAGLANLGGTDTAVFSVFAKKQNNRYINLRIIDDAASTGTGVNFYNATFDLESGVVTDDYEFGTPTNPFSDIEDYGNGWYRCWVGLTKKSGAARTDYAVYLVNSSSAGVNPTYAGTGNDGNYLYGYQLEAGSYPTSYIPNHSGGTITRGADVCIGSVNANNFNSEEGVLYAEVSLNLLTPNMYIQISDGTYSNRVAIINNNSSSIWRVFYRVNGVSQIDASESGLNTFETNKIAISWKLNEFKLYVNGVKITQVNSGSVNAANTFNRLEFKDIVGNNFYGNAKQVIVFPTALSDADLTTLTTL